MSGWTKHHCVCDECFHSWFGLTVRAIELECPRCRQMAGRWMDEWEVEYLAMMSDINKMGEENLLRLAVRIGFHGRKYYQEQKKLVEAITIKTDDSGAYRMDIKQDSETKSLIGRLQIQHKADDVEWDEFLENKAGATPASHERI